MPPARGFTILELFLATTLFTLLGALLLVTLLSTTRVWRQTSARERALGELLKARAHLTRDIVNASQVPGQFATAQVGPSLGAGRDGDALTVLTSEDGQTPWNLQSDGSSVLTAQVSYALWVPHNVNTLFGHNFVGVADANGYEDACPYKWLMRRQDPPPALVPPATHPLVASNWATTLLARPNSMTMGPNQRAVATLTGFRVLASGGLWQFELSATAVEDARQKVTLGSTSLGTSPYILVQRFSLPTHN